MAIDQVPPLASIPDFGPSEMQRDERMSASAGRIAATQTLIERQVRAGSVDPTHFAPQLCKGDLLRIAAVDA
ncbi:hypothetical protein [Parasedimentitalea huanghaiensis]|uniref:Uncharacterized protein n=1 Tax=Parasedimentitalea huanghaiensis TaxID=2682100 RepID=A0A6L6WNN6_9RHOB|nr:hypothetical protein [Zongyanglinia huanghaiensis]MVO18275.1 hypothetical protein [Zongyanglinia huanghaiensis]